MSLRRPKASAHEARRWREFLVSERALFASAGLPGMLADQRLFDDFLMHAFVPMPGGLADGTAFSIDELGDEQRRALGRLVALYLERFATPGLDTEISLLVAGSTR